MAQSLVQRQEQKLLQQQRLTQQQMMVVRMLEMPLAEFEQAVKTEIDDNPALKFQPIILNCLSIQKNQNTPITQIIPILPRNKNVKANLTAPWNG